MCRRPFIIAIRLAGSATFVWLGLHVEGRILWPPRSLVGLIYLGLVLTRPVSHAADIDMDEVVIRVGIVADTAEAHGKGRFVDLAKRPAG